MRQNNTYGVLKLTLHPTSYDWQFVPEAGKTFTDSGTGTCHGGTPPPGGSDTQKPSVPGNLSATPSVGQVALNWIASTDNVGVTGYRIYRGSAQIGTVGTSTSYTDTSVAANTGYSYTVRAEDAAGNLSDPSTAASATTPASTILTLSPEADSRVQESAATTNYATSTLRTDGGTNLDTETFLRFNVTGATGTVASAKLRIYAYTATVDGPAVYRTDTGWSETAINWNNRPARTSGAVDDKGAIATNTWVEYDVTQFVTGNGTYGFDLATTSSDGVDFRSREHTTATQRPELVVTTSGPDTQKPMPPSGLTAVPAAGEVALNWNAATDNVGVTGYQVFRGSTPIATLGGNVTSYTDTALAAGGYSYTVRAVDAAGLVSDPSNTATAVVPDTTKPTSPGSLSATGSAGQVALAWQPSTDNVGVTGYEVYRGTTVVATVGPSTNSYTETGLAPGTYHYSVRAFDAAGLFSDPSNVADATVPDVDEPDPPGSLTAAAPTSAQVNLGWQTSQDNVGVTGYRIYRDDSEIGTAPASATFYEDTSVSATATYRYTVRAVDAALNVSDPSNEAQVTVPDTIAPAAPGNLHTTAVTGSQVDLAWSGSNDNVAVTGYRVFRDDTPIADVTEATTSYSDGPIAPGTYQYTVHALDSAGNLSQPSNAVIPTVPDIEPPTAPGNLDASAQGSFQVDLTWEESQDNVGVTGYRIYRDDVAIDTVGPVTSYTDYVLPPAIYTYHVRALDAAGLESGPSNPDTVTMVPPDDEDPTVPGNLTATLNGSNQVDLTWEESNDNVLVTGYRVYRNGALIATVDPSDGYSDTAVPARDHEYVVRAEDAAGNLSDPSNPASVVVPDTDNPAPPSGLTAAAADGGPVLLAWEPATDNVGIAQYEVYRDDQLIDTIDPATSYSDAVGPGDYAYHLRALDPSGNRSDPSGTATITVLPVDTEDPGPPAEPHSARGRRAGRPRMGRRGGQPGRHGL